MQMAPPPNLTDHTPHSHAAPELSDRHIQILTWVQEGKSAGDIGQIIGISGRTVEWHLANIFEALGVRTRVQAVVRAREFGILPAGERHGRRPAAERSFRRSAQSR
jgi:DNA-binding CsgD family transcriptional regulator